MSTCNFSILTFFFQTFLYVNMNKAQINIIMLNVEIRTTKQIACQHRHIIISHASTQRHPLLYG